MSCSAVELAEVGAALAWEAQRAYYLARGWPELPPWCEATPLQQQEALERARLVAEGYTLETIHELWRKNSERDGWSLGEYDPAALLHPHLVPFALLPLQRRRLDVLLHDVIQALYTACRPT